MTEIVKVFLDYVNVFFILYLLVYSTFLFLSVTVGTSVLYKQFQMRQLHNELKHDYYLPISIIVPAYNEEITVVDTVISLLQSQYKLFEIIVVDDGSQDNTSQVLIDYFHMHPIDHPVHKQIPCQPEEFFYQTYRGNIPITLVRKKNGGKADSLNMGINVSKYPYFICMDADSMLQDDALENIIRPVMEDENVIACGGLVKISNGVTIKNGKVVNYKLPSNPLVCMQILEYDRSFLASRIFLDQFNANLIISGAFGLFKKELVIAAGGYDHSTMGEDMELVVKLHLFCRAHNIPYSIRYASEAICWSQAPTSLRDLMKQRKRWHLGLFQSLWKHRKLFANTKFGVVSVLSYTYFLLYELFSPFIELFGLATILLAFAFNLINVPFMILFFLIYAGFGALLSLTAFFARIHTQNLTLCLSDVVKVVGLCLFENAGLRLILAFVRMTAFIGYKRGKHQWGRIKRQKMSIEL
ncbi:glycosyltransferase family 2 protein [Zongyangia hominis]|uniref:Glycosyltransferase family 2 protein n=1 Tax=Zongyangia hominis TaxID=2763677 RepID=A0A926IAX8_9FIRM|nr:glycosyltransferase family 2 protein [Zongyangia hominis]MBC8569565.1 glycosyltransferase family 2 protein [Zongyangia hominis]